MASVSVTKCVFKKSGTTITGSVTFQLTFSAWEVALNLSYQPTVHITPSLAATSTTFISMGRGKINLVGGRKDVAFPAPALCPSGNLASVATVPISVEMNALFNYGYERYFNVPTAGVDVRVDLAPTTSLTQDIVQEQPVVA